MMLAFECSLHSQAVLSKPVESFHMQYWVSLWRHCWSTHYTVLTRITRQNLSELQKHHLYIPPFSTPQVLQTFLHLQLHHIDEPVGAIGSGRRSRGAGKGKEEGGRRGSQEWLNWTRSRERYVSTTPLGMCTDHTYYKYYNHEKLMEIKRD